MSSRFGGALYLDSSALVKLAVREPETPALKAALLRWPLYATSSITTIEVARAISRARARQHAAVLATDEVEDVLGSAIEVILTDRVRLAASALAPPELRALDAIHVASALALGDDLTAIVTYDVRMQQAAERRRLAVLAPA